jgi:hypothetical protein
MMMPHNDWYIRYIIAHNDEECDVPVKCVKKKDRIF